MKRWIGLALGAAMAIGVGIVSTVDAADHLDPAGRVAAGDAGDIGDLYAWHSEGTMSVILTFAGPVAPGTAPTYDDDILYSIHIDGSDADHEADTTIHARFGQAPDDSWGVRLENVPGAGGDIRGAVATTHEVGNAKAHAGPFDDPFFMDLQGFRETLASETLSFDGSDFFAGQNVTAIVVEFPIDDIGVDGPYNVWATTGMR